MFETFFISASELPTDVLSGEYTPYLVLLSYIVASAASYAGLTIASNIFRTKNNELRNLLHIGGAFALGSGIWSMHFIGMLAYQMKIPFYFDPELTLLSILIAVASAVGVLAITRFKNIKSWHFIASSLLLGFAICSMHYTGMAAMRIEANLFYTPGLFLLSLGFAVVSSGAALGLVFYEKQGGHPAYAVPLRILAALILGLGVCGMHYIGMEAANFLPLAAMCRASDGEIFPMMDTDKMALMVTLITGLVLILTLTVGIYNQEQNAIADSRKGDAFPMHLISLSVLLTLLAIVALGGFSARVAGHMKVVTAQQEKAHVLSVNYLEVDKKLSNSLSLFALTGDAKWGDSYLSYAYEQQRVLTSLKDIIRDASGKQFSEFDELEERRSRIDREILNTAGTLSTRSAILLLQSKHYQDVKAKYEESFDRLIKEAVDNLYRRIERLVETDYLILFFSLVSAIILSIIWYFAFRSVRRWQRELIETRNNLHERYVEKTNLETRMNAYLEEVKRARDRALQAMREADHANRAKTDFLTNMSHELRTPMNSILGLTEVLLRNEKTIPEHKELLSVILEAGETLLKILNDLLDIAKIEAQGLVLQKKQFSLQPMLNTVVNTLKPMADEKNLELKLNFDPAEIYLVEDEVRLSRIFTNLLGNAIKYTDQGSVEFRVHIVPGRGGAASSLRAEIIDTGIGIAQDKLDIIFEKFSQADNSTTRKYGGTGLGLAITKQLVEHMNGKIGVESIAGQGSKFWIEIPVEVTQFSYEDSVPSSFSAPRLLENKDRIPFGEAHLLVAEDHPLNQIFMQTLFSEIGFENVTFANNGLEVLEILKKDHIDIILMDCQMPELNGYETTRKIREMEALTGANIPIVAMTARAMIGDRQACIDAGMNDYISKPIDVQKLQNILSRWTVTESGK